MKTKEINIKKSILQREHLKKCVHSIKYKVLLLAILGINACTDFVEIDPPKNTLVAETVFEDSETVESALANVYVKMRDDGMVSGNFGLGLLMGSYSDELDYYNSFVEYSRIYNHGVINSSSTALEWWTHAYNIIYAVNDIIIGLDQTQSLSTAEINEYKGQALFVRAFIHSLLVGMYGDVPYITTTDYLKNNTVGRMSEAEVYAHVIDDLIDAIDLLGEDYVVSERVIPNRWVAKALLARIYLYTENWGLAETTASQVLDGFELEPDVANVFLKESSEAIWQFKPDDYPDNNANEASWLIIRMIPGNYYAVTDELLSSFEEGDQRLEHWISSFTSESDEEITLYYAHKYKEAFYTTELSLEYTIVFRLAEQYLIRAEARAQLENISGAQQDLNVIRNRAGLANTTAAGKADLLDAILQERRVELFTEQGHRWFDLKRMGKASEVLAPIKTNWKDTDVLFPIPLNEIELNPNLEPQNPGY
ncbi:MULTISPECIES: RagB/SusD family nutrient uptake outer membrane protein [Flagellimonas]|uniref:RagB/SusD family nutrient uptake outer membrane protein n=1 Tax=Flagellimonas olearia TaxID=552546 RepID=A0A444VI41_9FLAO|nr:RagB/SusD family nutrient uptake outer membrane protein [Allomuricauda olearia]RYC50429.1 hypothetical protein DN53_05795 [Allomuricauda olearia]